MSRSNNPIDALMKVFPNLLMAFLHLASNKKQTLDFHRFIDLSNEFTEILKRYTDTLVLVHDKSKNISQIIHAEFQSTFDADMGQRMLMYCLLVELKYKITPKQFCINLFKVDTPQIRVIRKVKAKNYKYQYTEINICNMNPDDFKHHPDLSVAISSVLMDIPKDKQDILIDFLLHRIVKSELTDKQKSDYIIEIDYLCGLRKGLIPVFEQKIKSMSVYIDVEDSVIFRLGKNKGQEEGQLRMAKKLWEDKIPLHIIKKCTDLSNEDWDNFLKSIGQTGE